MSFEITFGQSSGQEFCPVCESSDIARFGMEEEEEVPFVCLGCSSSFNMKDGQVVSVDIRGIPEGYIAVYDLEEL